MSITLDNALNLNPRRRSFASPLSKDDSFTFDLIRLENQAQREFQDTNMDTNSEISSRRNNQSDDENGKVRYTSRTTSNGDFNGRRPPPPRPFRRHISLPASIFMSYLMAEQNLLQEKRVSLYEPFRNERFAARKLSKIDGSCSSHESSTEAEGDEIINSSSNEDGQIIQGGDSSSSYASDSPRDTPLFQPMSIVSSGSAEELNHDDQDEQAFTSEIERKSLVLRYMRKLIRQDTSGNFAPPDYCI